MEGLTQRPLGWATGSGGHSTPSLPSGGQAGGQAGKHVFTEAGPQRWPQAGLRPPPPLPAAWLKPGWTVLEPQFPPLKHEDCNDPDPACPTLQEREFGRGWSLGSTSCSPSAPPVLGVLTSLLHEGEQVVQELLPLGV